MNALKLNSYAFETLAMKFPTFPGKKGKHLMRIKVSFNTALYSSEKRPDNAAVKLLVSVRNHPAISKQPRVSFDASIVGIFSRLDKTKSMRVLAKQVAAPLLYDLVLEHTTKIFSHAIISGFHLPPKLGKTKQTTPRPSKR